MLPAERSSEAGRGWVSSLQLYSFISSWGGKWFHCVWTDYLFLFVSRLCNERQRRITRITYCCLFFPLRQENKHHQRHTKRLDDWLRRDGEQLQPVFTLLVRWTAVASAALLPSLPRRPRPAPRQQLISRSPPCQQQQRSARPPEEGRPPQGQRKEVHAKNVRPSES